MMYYCTVVYCEWRYVFKWCQTDAFCNLHKNLTAAFFVHCEKMII